MRAGQFDHALGRQARLEDPQVFRVPLQPPEDVIGDAPPLPRRGLEHRVRA